MSSSLDPTYPLYPCLSFVGFILCSIPLSWHIQAWNSGTCAFAIWTGLACLNGFVNSMLWAGNTRNIAPVWCDISSKLIIGVSIGIPASILCISRRLYCIISVQTSSITRGDKRRMVIIDLCIAVGLPVIIMILHYIVQGHRFDILEDFGCFPIVYNTLPAYFIYFMWPVLLGVISFIYSSLTLLSFWRRRAQFGQLLSSNSALSPSRYLRLMTLAIIDMMCTVPLGVYTIFIGLNGIDLAPWVSWEETHFDFARAGRVRALFWRSDPSFEVSVELTRWLPVVCAFTFFALFGFASEARKHYWKAFWALAKLCGIKPSTTKKPFVELPRSVILYLPDINPRLTHMKQLGQAVQIQHFCYCQLDGTATLLPELPYLCSTIQTAIQYFL
ncbi:STE3-like pheromone receptor [Coprinopsis marcescibilis]|uniref:STE3-like pheromone receptor n=1 Tax=Coprinopsis marcescibilis TaxID=230819 RepID=A0A5C3LEK6_COPMA|nr:STE3-like pheromone receptor [Coprinopsis marcescibilis]